MRYEYDYFSLLHIDEEAAHTLMYVYIDFFKLFVTSNKWSDECKRVLSASLF